MPRKLPWATQSKSSKTQVNLTSRPTKKARGDIDSDDDFFSGTVLESSGKGKGSADVADSEDELPGLPKAINRGDKGKQRKSERALSSSPPAPASNLPPPKIEYMRKGINKFELQDDEWMMVEDELLETANLFTRHLYREEYDRLKEIVQAKKDIVRPVVTSAKPSEERQMQMKAEKKTKSQERALKDVFSSGKGDIDDYLGAPKRVTSKTVASSPFARSGGSKSDLANRTESPMNGLDSDDLDAIAKSPRSKRATTSGSFVKPDPPSASQNPTTSSRIGRERTPRTARSSTFDFDDGYKFKRPPSPTKPAPSSTLHSPSPKSETSTQYTQPLRRRPSTRPGRSINSLFDDDDNLPKKTAVSREQAERLAKRQAEREKKKEEERRKSIGLNDIPTFLF